MSKKTKITQLTTLYEQFKALGFNTLFENPGTYTDWEGLDFEEFKTSVEYIIATYDEAFEKEIFLKLPFASLNALFNSLNGAKTHCATFIAQKQQAQFQQAASQVDSVVYQLMVYDVNYYLMIGKDIEEIKNVYEAESQKIIVNNAEVDKLKASVKSLIEPAVSGSLSKSFSDRKSSLFKSRLVWGTVSILFAISAIIATYCVSNAVITSIENKNILTEQIKSKKAPAENTKKEETSQNDNKESWSLILLRSIVLIPIYIGFGFSFSQYRKERELEEEYAHKAAVATTLPNYGDLAKDDGVKDQIVSGASNVIFASPVHKYNKQNNELDVVDSIKNLFDSASKAFKRDE